ncbi:hypothetical protein [Halalkalicoccus salilacus]|uniref:hypothetical protein n=1 Tax=Halalkalicoccus salilacus TaxID=3117459 RepID=UPI00300F640E
MSLPPSYDPAESDTDREEVLSILEDAIHDVRARTKERAVETPEDERMLIKWYRTLGTLSGQYRMLQRDTDIDEMEADLELLQEVTNLRDQEGPR